MSFSSCIYLNTKIYAIRTNECIDGITYTKLPNKSYSYTELFDTENSPEIFVYLDKTVVAETKGTMDSLELRPIEQAKIKCAKKLFNELSDSKVVYHEVSNYQELLTVINNI